ncbi:MAG: formylmethanofuran dehydrogenase subunit C [Methanobrevibacter wolinii]|uniref:formylmethanofuran dehydrogenase subunit C n=1 Tax=Methanobrevibacter wolinii TaxID=190977 RepID=UPI0005B2BE86|nr:formylmethanofuran dehydrogenase subunit C [Methanobrevibacter wolinii]MDD5959735.1 formylmethanofuran dehydrogenase subunit C [Methanobrevibacter wolinii]
MKTITFDVKKRNPIALEFDEIIPDTVYTWEAEDFDKYAVPVGNSRFPLTDFFDITVEGTADSPAEVKMVFNGDCGRVKYIGNKMSAGEIIVNGDADLHAGAEMSGGKMTVMGNVEAHAGREMSGGELEIFGNTKEFTGASYIGEWRGMTGGKIIVHGNAGKQCGECLTGGNIHVLGDCDILAGIHMTKGVIEIDGNVNRWPGGQMKNGNIIIHGKLGRLLEGFVEEDIVTDPEINGEVYEGRYIQYKGDIALNGKGHLYLDAEKNRDKLSAWKETDDEYISLGENRKY